MTTDRHRLSHLLSGSPGLLFAVGAFASVHPLGSPDRSPQVRLVGRRPIVHPVDRTLALPVMATSGQDADLPLWVSVSRLAHRDCMVCETVWRNAFSEDGRPERYEIGRWPIGGTRQRVLVPVGATTGGLLDGDVG